VKEGKKEADGKTAGGLNKQEKKKREGKGKERRFSYHYICFCCIHLTYFFFCMFRRGKKKGL